MSRHRRRPKRVNVISTTFDKRGRVISKAQNSYTKTHTEMFRLCRSIGVFERTYLHAEVHAIIKARGRTIHKISIERYDKAGNPKLAMPCPICQEAIRIAGIKVVEYTVG